MKLISSVKERAGVEIILAFKGFAMWSAFENMIHYTMVKTIFFNVVGHPSIGSWNDQTGFKLIRTFGFEDYKNKLS